METKNINLNDLQTYWDKAAQAGPWTYDPAGQTISIHSAIIGLSDLGAGRIGATGSAATLKAHLMLKIHGEEGVKDRRNLDRELKQALDAVIPPSLRQAAYKAISLKP